MVKEETWSVSIQRARAFFRDQTDVTEESAGREHVAAHVIGNIDVVVNEDGAGTVVEVEKAVALSGEFFEIDRRVVIAENVAANSAAKELGVNIDRTEVVKESAVLAADNAVIFAVHINRNLYFQMSCQNRLRGGT